jgi:hypothetical protein
MTNNDAWAALLNGFTQRNAGRRTRLEINDPDLGVQRQEVDYPLLGVTYDRRDDRIGIMLGHLGSTEQHLMHSIVAPEEVNVLKPDDGRGEVLRVRHGNAQTLLSLE